MSHAPTCSLWKHLPIHALLIGGIALLAAASPAHAGLGDMMKKATDKATKAATQKATPAAPCKAVEYDDVTLELTNDRVEHILAAFKAAGDAGAGRPALVEKLNKVNEERGALWDKHGETIQATRSKRDDIKTCYHDGYQAAQERRTEEYTKRAMTTDPALLAKYQRAAAENNAAAAKGDSAAMNRIMQAMHEEIAPTPDDSLQVRKQCGPLPPKSAAEEKVDALDKQITSLNDQIATVDENVAKAQAKAGGMNDQQWAMALERIRNYMAYTGGGKTSSKSPPCGFSSAEAEALSKHAEQLKAVLG
jgi:predicted  nucleic acid-binding Zn-ribbon protein